MEFKKIDENTVRCIIDEYDMQENNIELEDFMQNNNTAHEFLHTMVERAKDEVGYEPGSGMISMQLMQLPENRLSITFSENSQGQVNEMIKRIKDVVGELGDVAKKVDRVEKKGFETKGIDKNVVEKSPSMLRIYVFDTLFDVEKYCVTIPEKINVKSNLYKSSGKYYLAFEKGRISMVNFNYMCNQAIEFSELISDNSLRKTWLDEHSDCLIKGKAIKVMKKLNS